MEPRVKFKTGDVVRCIDNHNSGGLKARGLYVVRKGNHKSIYLSGPTLIKLEGVPNGPMGIGFYTTRFEKVDPHTLTKLEKILWNLE